MRWVLWAAAVGGCGGHKDGGIVPAGDDDDGFEDTAPPVEDTAPDGTYLDAAFYGIVARFAWDPALGVHVPFAEPGGVPNPIELSVLIIDSDAYSTGVIDETTSCSVTFEADAPLPVASWVAGAGAWIGFEVPPTATIRDTCQFYGMPSEFQGDAAGHVAKWTWGIGIGPLDTYVEQQLSYSLPASQWDAIKDDIVGGYATSSSFATATFAEASVSSFGFGIGYAIDGNFEIDVGGTGNLQPLTAEEVHVDGVDGVARAYYEVQAGPFPMATSLTNEP